MNTADSSHHVTQGSRTMTQMTTAFAGPRPKVVWQE